MNPGVNVGLWPEVLDQVKSKIPKERFEMWLKEAALEEEGGNYAIVFPNNFAKEFAKSRIGAILQESLAEVTGSNQPVSFQVRKPRAEESVPSHPDLNPGSATIKAAAEMLAPPKIIQQRLNKAMTFATFVPGQSNRIAHGATEAMALGEDGISPLLIHGPHGVGKTHLLQAACKKIKEDNPAWKVSFMTCEYFVTEFCSSVTGSKREVFQRRIIELDVLAVDDVHKLGKKAGTQREFMYLFNELHNQNKCILLSSLVHPGDIEALDDGLKSRFMSGIMAPINKPTYPTRLAILGRQIKKHAKDFPKEELEYVARAVSGTPRELVGVANRLGLEQRFGTRMTRRNVDEILSEFISQPLESLSVETIESAVSELYNISPEQLKSKKQSKSISQARQVAFYLTRKLLSVSYKDIGEYYGGKNHTTVIAADRRVELLIETDPNTRASVDKLIRKLNPSTLTKEEVE
ncbi:MAG: chromosomal replication initiator protein DnaA [Planctomycetota bacterium]|nr:chromosomal replication initiator protein DnaA [Planctomycetota bacterium]